MSEVWFWLMLFGYISGYQLMRSAMLDEKKRGNWEDVNDFHRAVFWMPLFWFVFVWIDAFSED